MMRRSVGLVRAVAASASVLLMASCGGGTKEDYAAKAAKDYYDNLVAGRYIDYVNGIADGDSLPPSYKEQLLVNAKQFMAQQKEEHGGIVDVRTISSQVDSLHGRTDVFLLICFADSTKEEVVVPMVEHGGVWKMK